MLSKLDNIHWGATYTVRHLLQDLNRDGTGVEVGRYTEDLYERETLINTVPNTLSEAKVKEIPGFTAQPFEQVIVNGDGSTTIDIHYHRNPITLKFNPNGGFFVVEDGNASKQSEEPIEITQVYGTTGYNFPNPKITTTDLQIEFYKWVPVDTEEPLRITGEGSTYKDFQFPSTSGTYRALWDVTADIANISTTTQIPSGKLKLTGAVNTEDIKNLKNALEKSEVELDLAGLTISEGSNLSIGLIDKHNYNFNGLLLTKVALPTKGTVFLGSGAFSSCPSLESITIGSNVEVSHGGTFWGSTQLTFNVSQDHPELVTTRDKKALLRKISDESEEYSLVSYPSASGNINLGKLGFTITAIEEDALALLPDGNTTITFPATVKVIGPYADYQIDQGAHLTIIMEGTEPPTLPGEDNLSCSTFGSKVNIYVPDESFSKYQNAWQNYADKHDIYPMSEYGLH
ncbi:MAG: leucine-rich repeat protein [Treponema sp.]|nr:leucine-rich repeat protein [Treponema sp.]